MLSRAADVERMRDEHRLSGNLGGTLPQLSQQNAFLGVPMLLFPEQVVTLVSNGAPAVFSLPVAARAHSSAAGLAKLVDEPAAHQAPSAQQVHAYESSREAEIESQHARARELAAEKQIQLAKMLNAGDLSRKRAEREEKRQQLASAASEDLATAPPAPSAAPTSSAHAENHVISIESTSSVRLGYNAHGATAATVAEAKQAGFWKYPETKLERSRCKVFEDLWRQGHYLGVGMRFGGDFLVYPGEPLPNPGVRLHADTDCRRPFALPLALHPHRARIARATHHASRPGGVRTTGDGRQEGSPAWRLR